MNLNMKKINKLGRILGLMTVTLVVANAGNSASSLSAILTQFFVSSKTTIMLGGLVASLFGAYKLFFEGEKTTLNWFLFVGGAGFIGAYPTFTSFITNFAK